MQDVQSLKVKSLDDLGLKVLSPLEQNHIIGGADGDSVTTTVTVNPDGGTKTVTVSDGRANDDNV